MSSVARIPLWSFFALGLGLCILTWYGGHDWGGDFAAYLGQARALVDGGLHEYTQAQLYLQSHSDGPVGPTIYGWGFPLLLAPVYVLFGLELTIHKLYMSLFLLASAFVAYRLFADTIQPTHARLALMLLLFSPSLVDFTNQIRSDLPFTFFFVASFLILRKWEANGHSIRTGILLGLCIFLTYWIRPNGALLLAPMAVLFLSRWRRKQWRAGVMTLIPVGAYLGAYVLANSFLPENRSDADFFVGSALANPWENLLFYLREGGKLYLHSGGRVLFWFSLPVMLIGATRDASRRWSIQLVCALTLVLYLFWPATQGLRFLYPLVPIYCFYVALGFQELGVWRRPFRWVGVGFALAVLVHVGSIYAYRLPRKGPITDKVVVDGPYSKASRELWDFVRATDEHAVFCFVKPRVLYFYTGRQAIRTSAWEESPTKFVILRHAEPAPTWEVVFENEQFRVYRRPGTSRPPS